MIRCCAMAAVFSVSAVWCLSGSALDTVSRKHDSRFRVT